LRTLASRGKKKPSWWGDHLKAVECTLIKDQKRREREKKKADPGGGAQQTPT